MPNTPVLPAQLIARLPGAAQQQLIENAPFESYSTVAYSGLNGSTPVSGLFVEVDSDTWVENDLFTFQEISETDTEVILYDVTRDTTVFINLLTNDLFVQFAGNSLNWDVTDLSQSLTPVIPDGWTV